MNSVIKLAAATVTVVSALGFGLGIVSGSSTLADRGGSIDSVHLGDRGGSAD